jgi:hypothetical protein
MLLSLRHKQDEADPHGASNALQPALQITTLLERAPT